MEISGFHREAKPGDLILASIDEAQVEYTFRVSRVYKGSARREVKVATGFGGGDCGDRFDPDKRYVVYAFEEKKGTLTTGICAGNFEAEGENEDLRYLRKLPPEPEDNLPFPLASDPIEPSTESANRARVCGSVLSNDASSTTPTIIMLTSTSRFGLRVQDDTELEDNRTFCMNYVEPGDYLLLAIAVSDNGIENVTFYPGVARQSEATRLKVHPADQITKLVFGFQQTKLPSVSGHLLAVNAPLPTDEVYVVLLGDTGLPLSMPFAAKVESDGSFLFPAIPVGHYELMAVGGESSGSNSTSQWLTRKVEVDVSENVNGVQVELISRH
jgi:hypothetical protein